MVYSTVQYVRFMQKRVRRNGGVEVTPSLWEYVRFFSGPLYILYLNFEREG